MVCTCVYTHNFLLKVVIFYCHVELGARTTLPITKQELISILDLLESQGDFTNIRYEMSLIYFLKYKYARYSTYTHM